MPRILTKKQADKLPARQYRLGFLSLLTGKPVRRVPRKLACVATPGGPAPLVAVNGRIL